MKIVVDTNVVFSAILNSESKIGKILTTSSSHFELYSCDFLKTEVHNHKSKIQKITKLPYNEIEELEKLVTQNITFINENLIPKTFLTDAELFLKDIDINDTSFLALTKFLKATLWTGDLQLVEGLRNKNFRKVITTNQLSFLLNELENK